MLFLTIKGKRVGATSRQPKIGLKQEAVVLLPARTKFQVPGWKNYRFQISEFFFEAGAINQKPFLPANNAKRNLLRDSRGFKKAG